MGEEQVWVCKLSAGLAGGFIDECSFKLDMLNSGVPVSDESKEEILSRANEIVQAQRANEKGIALPAEALKWRLFSSATLNFYDVEERPIPYVFIAGRVPFISQELADVLQQFDMGDGALYPVALLDGIGYRTKMRKPLPIDSGPRYFWNYGNQKQAFLPEESKNIIKSSYGIEDWYLSGADGPHDVAVSAVALEGPDVWVDPALSACIFMSDRLVQALKAANLHKRFNPMPCRVIKAGPA